MEREEKRVHPVDDEDVFMHDATALVTTAISTTSNDVVMDDSVSDDDDMGDMMSCDDDPRPYVFNPLPSASSSSISLFEDKDALPLDTTLHDSVLEVDSSSKKRWNVSRTCLNRLPYFHTMLLAIETGSVHDNRVFHEIMPIYEGDSHDKRVGKRQVFRIREENEETLGYIIQALHCLYQTEDVLAPIVQASRNNGDILLLLEHCNRYMYKALAHACRQELARMILDVAEFSLAEVMQTIRLFDENRLIVNDDGSFAAKSELDLMKHPILLALLHRLRVSPITSLDLPLTASDAVACSYIPSFILLKLIVFSGLDGAAKQTYFTETLIARALGLVNIRATLPNQTLEQWDQLVVNICQENKWEKEKVRDSVQRAWIRSLSIGDRTPMSIQRRAISDTRHNRSPGHSREVSRGRTTSHPPTLPSLNIVWSVDIDTAFEFALEDSAILSATAAITTKSDSQQYQLSQRTPVDGAPTLPITFFVARETTNAPQQFTYRLCCKLCHLVTAEFSGVLYASTPSDGTHEVRLHNRKVSSDPLALHVFDRSMPATRFLPIRLYGFVTQS